MSTKTIFFRDKEFVLKGLEHINIEDAYNFKPTLKWMEKIEQNESLYLDELEFRDIFYIQDNV